MLIFIILLTVLLMSCAKSVVTVKPQCVVPIIKISSIDNDRDLLIVLDELKTIIKGQKSAIECYEKAFK